MSKVIRRISLCLIPMLPVDYAEAEDRRSLDTYTCAEFLADRGEVTSSAKTNVHMMEYWATGYAAAHQKNVQGATKSAVAAVASILNDACREKRSQTVVEAITNIVAHFNSVQPVEKPASSGVSATAPSSNYLVAMQAPMFSSPRSGVGEGFAVVENYDLRGGDFGTLKNVEPMACSNACRTDPKCKAYTFDRWNRWCFLKSGVSELSLAPNSTSAIRNSVDQPIWSKAVIKINRSNARAFVGPRSRKAVATSQEACEEACRTNGTCVGYTFAKPTLCTVFDYIESFSSTKNAISGLKTQ